MNEVEDSLFKAIIYALITNTDFMSKYSDETFEKIYTCIKIEHDSRELF